MLPTNLKKGKSIFRYGNDVKRTKKLKSTFSYVLLGVIGGLHLQLTSMWTGFGLIF